MAYHCTKCGKKYKWYEVPKEKASFGRKDKKKRPACCGWPLRKISSKVYKQIQ